MPTSIAGVKIRQKPINPDAQWARPLSLGEGLEGTVTSPIPHYYLLREMADAVAHACSILEGGCSR